MKVLNAQWAVHSAAGNALIARLKDYNDQLLAKGIGAIRVVEKP
jgi:hypothetical protein